MKKIRIFAALLLTLTLLAHATPSMALELKKGEKSQAVQELQMRLNALGYTVGTIDGSYGDQSEEAVIKFQQDHGLEATGVVDDATWEALYDESVTISNDKYSADILLTAPFLSISESDGQAVLALDDVECKVDIIDALPLESLSHLIEKDFKEEFETIAAVDYQGSNEDSGTLMFSANDHGAFVYHQTFDYVVDGQNMTMYSLYGALALDDMTVVRVQTDFKTAQGAEVLLNETSIIELLSRIRTSEVEK